MADITRRSLLAAASGVPFSLKADDQSGTRPLIIGEGAYQYEWLSDWGRLLANIKYDNCHALAEDSHGNLLCLPYRKSRELERRFHGRLLFGREIRSPLGPGI
jgi:hypothetical protein